MVQNQDQDLNRQDLKSDVGSISVAGQLGSEWNYTHGSKPRAGFEQVRFKKCCW